MRTDREIRKFMRDNRIQVPKNDRFMSELVRQIDLLPPPAAFNGSEEELLRQKRLLVEEIRAYLRRYLRRKAIATLFINAVICLVMLLTVFLAASSESSDPSPLLSFIKEWSYIISGVLCIFSFAISLRITGLGRI